MFVPNFFTTLSIKLNDFSIPISLSTDVLPRVVSPKSSKAESSEGNPLLFSSLIKIVEVTVYCLGINFKYAYAPKLKINMLIKNHFQL